jgi:hypothetical protein
VAPGVAAWEEFKDQAEAIALFNINKRAPGTGREGRGRRHRQLARVSTSQTARPTL